MVAQAIQRVSQRKFLIATSKAPISEASAANVADILFEAAAAVGLHLIGIRGVEAPGKSCYNIALAFDGTDNEDACETFMMEVAQAFFPSRWCDCTDADFIGVHFTL